MTESIPEPSCRDPQHARWTEYRPPADPEALLAAIRRADARYGRPDSAEQDYATLVDVLSRLTDRDDPPDHERARELWPQLMRAFHQSPSRCYPLLSQMTGTLFKLHPQLMQTVGRNLTGGGPWLDKLNGLGCEWMTYWEIQLHRYLLIHELGIESSTDTALLDAAMVHLRNAVTIRLTSSKPNDIAKADAMLARYSAELDRLRQRCAGRSQAMRHSTQSYRMVG